MEKNRWNKGNFSSNKLVIEAINVSGFRDLKSSGPKLRKYHCLDSDESQTGYNDLGKSEEFTNLNRSAIWE